MFGYHSTASLLRKLWNNISQLRTRHLLSNPLEAEATYSDERHPQQIIEDFVDQDESDLTSQQLHRELEQSLLTSDDKAPPEEGLSLPPPQLEQSLLTSADVSPPERRLSIVPSQLEQSLLTSADNAPPERRLSLLPPEILRQILSYIVVVPGNVHVNAPRNDSRHGWRLGLCPESFFDPCWGRCGCRSGSPGGPVPEYMDTALLLVSQFMRQTTLDITFAENCFTFTSTFDLRTFASELPAVAARIHSVRLYHNAGDTASWPSAETMASTRSLLQRLRHLDLRLILRTTSSSYESLHEDGFLNDICGFRKPLLERFECTVQWQGYKRNWRGPGLDHGIPGRVQAKLIKIFTGVYGDQIPLSNPPLVKIREADRPLSNKKGIIAWNT